jgi:hypothetical protein
MPRPYILCHNDKWFVFLGCSLVALCTSKAEALELQRDWIRKSQSIQSMSGHEDPYLIPTLPDRPTLMLENGNN